VNPRIKDQLSSFTRKQIALALGRKSNRDPTEISLHKWGGDGPTWITKAEVGASTRLDSDDFSHGESASFLDLVLQGSAVGKMNLRQVPLDARVSWSDVGSVGAFVAEGMPKPVSRMSLSTHPLTAKKVANLMVVSDEILNSNSDAAEAMLRADLARSISDALDLKFLSSDAASDEAPAGVLNGVSPVAAASDTGGSLSAWLDDFSGDLSRSVIVGKPSVLVNLAVLGGFQRVGAKGGELLGMNVIASRNAPADSLILIDAQRVAIANDRVEIGSSQNVAIEMSDTPSQISVEADSPGSVTPASLVSCFQVNATCFRGELFTNWIAAAGAVSLLDTGAWQGTSP
jgi:hypothetical protein